MKPFTVILFQRYLRRFIFNLGQYLDQINFQSTVTPAKPKLRNPDVSVFAKEITRKKDSGLSRLRRLVGIPNIRIRFDQAGDLYFTYACLLVSTKPYCTYIETGLALYNYDALVAKRPLARWLVGLLTTRKNCKQLIFMSEAAKKSFYATVDYPKPVREVMMAKSSVIYPIPIAKPKQIVQKKFDGHLRLLFLGTYYIKGGVEVAHAYERLRKQYTNLSLTIVTDLDMLYDHHRAYLKALPGLTLLNADLDEVAIASLYQKHDVFVLPTYREGFGLVLIEALAYGLPIITTDQFATSEMVTHDSNGFIFPDHPMKDYDPKTYKLHGQYHHQKDFYHSFFKFQEQGKFKPVEDFVYRSIKQFLDRPSLVNKFSSQSLQIYKQKFDAELLGKQYESVFLEAIGQSKAIKV